jgi:DNA-binding PadR family transcriptional regulator
MISRPLTIEHALLGFLQQSPLHGYQLYQQLCNPAGLRRVWYLKQAHLYALLSKLEEIGYIASSIQQQETRPARRVFRLTPTGREAFHAWLSSPVQRPRQMRDEFQTKLYFAQIQSREACRQLIAVQRQACYQWLAVQQKSAEQESTDNDFGWLVNQYRAKQIQAVLDWLDACQERLEHKVELETSRKG